MLKLYYIIEQVVDFILIFISQMLLYGICCVSYRAVVKSNYPLIIFTDIAFSSLNFFVIRRIADKEKDKKLAFVAYTLGSTIGSVLGTKVSELLQN